MLDRELIFIEWLQSLLI